jgi:hypothetical protein
MESEVCRTIPVSHHGLTRLSNDGEVLTCEFDHAATVTLVYERDRRKWEEHEHPEKTGDVVYLDFEDVRLLRLSKNGIRPQLDIHIIHENRTENHA